MMTHVDDPSSRRLKDQQKSTSFSQEKRSEDREEVATAARQRSEKAAYMVDLLSELRTMGRDEDWALLTYFLEMAIMEAQALAENRPGTFPPTHTETIVIPDARAQLLAKRFMNDELD